MTPAGPASRRARHGLLPACVALAALALAGPAAGQARVFYVAVAGSDRTGDGTFDQPWATPNYAMRQIPDEISTVVVGDGTYDGAIDIGRAYTTQTTLRAENAYHARLVASDGSVVTIEGAANLTLTGFDITRAANDKTGAPLIVVTDRLGSPSRNIRLRSNIVHDNPAGDLIQVQSGTQDLLVESNMLYNPGAGASHLALDGLDVGQVRENVLFDDFAPVGRPHDASGSFLAITNAEQAVGRQDRPLSREVTVERNIFLNWQGTADRFFVELGGSGVPTLEVDGLHFESNLLVGNGNAPLTASVGVLGARGVTIRANTVAGNLPGVAFAAEVDRRQTSPPNEDVSFYNNIWSDPNGTMSNLSAGDPTSTLLLTSANNLYWNHGRTIPDSGGVLSVTSDPSAVVDDPRLPAQTNIVLPRWDTDRQSFAGDYPTFLAAFTALSDLAATAAGSPAIDHADGDHMPLLDLLGHPRGAPDIGALEFRAQPSPTPTPAGGSTVWLPQLLRAH